MKKSLYLTQSTISFVEARTPEADDDARWSAQVNGAVSVLAETMRRNMPSLSVAAWHAVLDAYSGHAPTPGVVDTRVAGAVMDHLGIVDLDKIDADTAAAIRELSELTPEQAMAVYDLAVRFWCREWTTGQLGEWVTELGGKVK